MQIRINRRIFFITIQKVLFISLSHITIWFNIYISYIAHCILKSTWKLFNMETSKYFWERCHLCCMYIWKIFNHFYWNVEEKTIFPKNIRYFTNKNFQFSKVLSVILCKTIHFRNISQLFLKFAILIHIFERFF